MASVTAFLVLAIAFERGSGYLLEPLLDWPEEYHFNGEEIDLTSGVIKTFEIWYSEKHNRSRIDLNGGTNKKYYYGTNENGGSKAFVFHPETGEDEVPITTCRQYSFDYDADQEDFLPAIFWFEFIGHAEHGGKPVTVWIMNVTLGEAKSEETLYVYELDEGVGIPVQHIKKTFNLMKGNLEEHTIINYYNYDDDIEIESLEVDESKCSEFDPFNIESIKFLHPDIDIDVDMAFHGYKKHHKKDYVDAEHDLRKKIFKRNWKFIENTNSKNLGYTLTVNQFADRTAEELQHLARTKYSGPIQGTHPFPHTLEEVEHMASNSEIPEEHDLRIDGVISPVRNQAHCGSCWAFAAAATLEGVIARSNGGRIIDLSEQSLVDCAWQYRSAGCQGTEAIDAVYEYVLKNGIPTVREYGPYLMEDDTCKIKNMTEVYKIKGYVAVTPMSPNALKAAVHKYGPVTIGVLATQAMVFYNSGVFYDMECEPGALNHAVTLVGYGVRNGELYWIVKNSWGETWGEDGYILMLAKKDNCNVMYTPVYPLV